MAIEEDVVRALEKTVANLKQQSDLLRAQAADMRNEAAWLRTLSTKARGAPKRGTAMRIRKR
jgi:hypothetical protein